jgi:Holliday junction resolvasome RuvABC ATP-dependent DNA helicase subunit
MTKEQLVAQAVARWISLPGVRGRDFMREALPLMDVGWFFSALAGQEEFNSSDVSIAIAGFPLSATDLEVAFRESGLRGLRGLTDDLHVAADWRNNRSEHPVIISLAHGWHPGVSTLDHFGSAQSKDLTYELVDWAETSGALTVNDLQLELLRALRSGEIADLLSLDSVSSFLASWFAARDQDTLDAPRAALPQLGLFADPGLFSRPGEIGARLLANFKVVAQVKDAAATALRAVERNLNKRFRNDLATRDRLLIVCEKLERVRLYPTVVELASVTSAEAQEVFRPPKDIESQEDSPPPDNDDDNDQAAGEAGRGGRRELASATGDDLLDDNQERLTTRIIALEEALDEALEKDEKTVEADVEIGGEEVRIRLDIDAALLDWLHTFCSEEVFGGLLVTREPSLSVALKQHGASDTWKLEPVSVAVMDGRTMALRDVFADWDTQLARRGHQVSILADWDQFIADRTTLITHLDRLFQFPLDWMAGRPEMAAVVDRYLATATSLYRQVQSQFRNMVGVDQGWAEIGLHGLLALDVMQIKCELEDDRESWKAVLLPTHPLHLWRYQRLASVLRGLGSTLSVEDRQAVIDECRRPEQFLSVLYASSLPANKGGARLLPISSDLHGLATFENLQNACSGLDGVETIRYAMDRFTVSHPLHLRPMRVGVLNPPDAPRLAVALAKILGERRESSLPALRLEFFSTTSPAVRGRSAQALAFSSETMDVLEARLSSGRLEMQIHEEPRSLEHWIAHWRREPQHVLVLFDEAGVSIRRSDMGLPMPMSPFCVRKVIRYQELRGTVRLDPTTDEPPFSEFMQLMNEADRGQRDSTPNAWADAENLRHTVDVVLQGDEPGAFWLGLADRALPAESGLQSVRLLARREDQREVLLLARDYRRLADLVRPAFNRWNLDVTTRQLCDLLEEGVHLSGAGILNLVKKDGTVDANQVLGLAGTLLAARDYAGRHPGALIVSADQQIARHWLRLGKRSERCDLIALRQEGEGLVLEAIEVKSTQGTVADVARATLDQAVSQLLATLEAVADGLRGAGENCGPLSVPRCEMLKEVLVRACLGKQVTPELRSMWCGWLSQIFGQEGEPLPVQIRGEIVRVALGESAAVAPVVVHSDNASVVVRTLGEDDVQHLIERGVASVDASIPVASAPLTIKSNVSAMQSEPEQPPAQQAGALLRPAFERPSFSESPRPSALEVPLAQAARPDVTWPPQQNELGMIGQDETVRQIMNRLMWARDKKRRFSNSMLVGPAGVGKSSFARAIAKELLGESPIMFSGADIRSGLMIIQRLDQENKVPQDDTTPIRLASCVIFIDEVHALPSSVSNILLNALEGDQVTSIDNTLYDFSDVVFLMATTDPGKHTEAFQSRSVRVDLQSYTLPELAGILWLHGKDELEGFELGPEVCIEIAARCRAKPRRAVKTLKEEIIPHLYAQIKGSGNINYQLLGEAMTVEAVAAYFDNQGIDANGLDMTARNFLSYLDRHGANAEERIKQGLGISNRNDFVEVDEYLQRLGLVMVRGGRSLTAEGRRYLRQPFDLRHRIARQQ